MLCSTCFREYAEMSLGVLCDSQIPKCQVVRIKFHVEVQPSYVTGKSSVNTWRSDFTAITPPTGDSPKNISWFSSKSTDKWTTAISLACISASRLQTKQCLKHKVLIFTINQLKILQTISYCVFQLRSTLLPYKRKFL